MYTVDRPPPRTILARSVPIASQMLSPALGTAASVSTPASRIVDRAWSSPSISAIALARSLVARHGRRSSRSLGTCPLASPARQCVGARITLTLNAARHDRHAELAGRERAIRLQLARDVLHGAEHRRQPERCLQGPQHPLRRRPRQASAGRADRAVASWRRERAGGRAERESERGQSTDARQLV